VVGDKKENNDHLESLSGRRAWQNSLLLFIHRFIVLFNSSIHFLLFIFQFQGG